MASKVEEIVRDAVRQGWRKLQGAKHIKLWTPDGKKYQTVPHDYYRSGSNWHAERNFESQMRKLGYRPSSEIKAEEKTKVTSVKELIEANGQGGSIVTPPAPTPAKPEKRQSRAGMEAEIVRVLKGSYPQEMDFTTLKMKVSLNYPGVSQATLHGYIAKVKATGQVLNPRMGYYRAASADVEVTVQQMAAPKTPLEPVLPGEYKLVIDNLMNAVAEAEKLIVRLTRQLAEQSEAAEMIKRMAAKL